MKHRSMLRRGTAARVPVGTLGLALGLAVAGGAAAEGVKPAEMAAFCRGEASSEFGVNPRAIETGEPEERAHAWLVDGTFEGQGGARTPFRCRFDKTGQLKFVRVLEEGADDGEGAMAGAGASPAERAGGGDFDATGMVPCAEVKGQPMGQCRFGVARGEGGAAAVVVTLTSGRKRALFFEGGAFSSADTSQADGYPEYGAEKEADLFKVFVGDERYEIPEAAIFGG